MTGKQLWSHLLERVDSCPLEAIAAVKDASDDEVRRGYGYGLFQGKTRGESRVREMLIRELRDRKLRIP